jgi:hypothetical protein
LERPVQALVSITFFSRMVPEQSEEATGWGQGWWLFFRLRGILKTRKTANE